MASPSKIIEDLARGKAYFAKIDSEKVKKSMDGCSGCGCGGDLWECLYSVVKSLEIRTQEGVFDEITDKLHHKMVLLIGNLQITPPEPLSYNAYYGFSSVDYFDNYQDILFQFTKSFPLGSTSISFDFTNASQGLFLFFKVPTGQPVFRDWFIDIDEYGNIPDIQWRDPVTFNNEDYYLSRQLVFLNPGRTTITYTGSLVLKQKITLSIPLSDGAESLGGSINVIENGFVIKALAHNETVTLDRTIPKLWTFNNSISPINGFSVYVDGTYTYSLDVFGSYDLTNLSSTADKSIQFFLQEE